MEPLEKLISRPIEPERRRMAPTVVPLIQRLAEDSKQPFARYEAHVFNFLLDHKLELGITEVVRFKGLLVDGAITLASGRRLAIEVKFRMNWAKASQAGWQFKNFLAMDEPAAAGISGGIVVFEEFSADWARTPKATDIENGWIYWYTGHSKTEGRRVDLLRLRGGASTRSQPNPRFSDPSRGWRSRRSRPSGSDSARIGSRRVFLQPRNLTAPNSDFSPPASRSRE